jgi:hypothetical protein
LMLAIQQTQLSKLTDSLYRNPCGGRGPQMNTEGLCQRQGKVSRDRLQDFWSSNGALRGKPLIKQSRTTCALVHGENKLPKQAGIAPPLFLCSWQNAV